MTKQRYILTGEWTGPSSPAGDFNPFQHRECVTEHRLVLWAKDIGRITFTDGTALILRAEPMQKGERFGAPILGYKSLIRDCFRYGVDSVAALCAAQKLEKQITGVSK